MLRHDPAGRALGQSLSTSPQAYQVSHEGCYTSSVPASSGGNSFHALCVPGARSLFRWIPPINLTQSQVFGVHFRLCGRIGPWQRSLLWRGCRCRRGDCRCRRRDCRCRRSSGWLGTILGGRFQSVDLAWSHPEEGTKVRVAHVQKNRNGHALSSKGFSQMPQSGFAEKLVHTGVTLA